MDDTVYDVDAFRSRRIVHIVQVTLGRRIDKVKLKLCVIWYVRTCAAHTEEMFSRTTHVGHLTAAGKSFAPSITGNCWGDALTSVALWE